jgi:CubicO group peptidase (beta-lactamase class C family)
MRAGPAIRGHRLKRRYHWAGSWQTFFWIDPVKEVIGIFMSQSAPSPSKASAQRFDRSPPRRHRLRQQR